MHSPKLTRRLFWAAEVLLLAGTLTTAAATSRAQEWRPLLLVVLLLVLALVGQRLSVTIRSGQLTAAFIALVLAMCLLGPAPAVLFGVLAMIGTSALRRLPPAQWLNNLTTFSVFPLVGGEIVRVLVGSVNDPHSRHLTQSVTFAILVFAVFMVTVTLNFAMVALDVRIEDGRSLVSQTRELFIPLLPGHVAAGALAAALAVAFTNLGLPVLLVSILVLLIFQYLTAALLRSEDRADKLEARSIHLASLQLGVLVTLVETLALRDRTTARHAAEVARSARALAVETGCSEAEQDLVHTAGLLHDIGKFALPDRILHAEALTDQDRAAIRRHPQDGATLVGRLDGYGPVADAILYHHERVDGGGYPAGLIGNEIPLSSRIISICSTYDTLTARDSYRPPMSPEDAIAELRRSAGTQLDSELVESFIAMVERMGPSAFARGEEAEFEAELAFERRTRKIAQPSLR
jgi:putative nucleotidyltransferase with HDIG domain